ncbi:hypothetical protein M413DRAFT_188580 [Hebeloma cylindrosporum]|uniref:Uncharacterized protein n=1 Tax=Hebeloma cylindrosporum TaxID=76867 RepID=A0A0C2XQR9_HEBCY|nr:hypothetical protein M413DRAFT_188580 [Hebeloma cylindrosporum h7]
MFSNSSCVRIMIYQSISLTPIFSLGNHAHKFRPFHYVLGYFRASWKQFLWIMKLIMKSRMPSETNATIVPSLTFARTLDRRSSFVPELSFTDIRMIDRLLTVNSQYYCSRSFLRSEGGQDCHRCFPHFPLLAEDLIYLLNEGI